MNAARTRIARAQARALCAQHDLMVGLQPWRRRVDEHRAAISAASGFAAGFVLTLLPSKFWSHAGSLAFSAVSRHARSIAWLPTLLKRVRSKRVAEKNRSA